MPVSLPAWRSPHACLTSLPNLTRLASCLLSCTSPPLSPHRTYTHPQLDNTGNYIAFIRPDSSGVQNVFAMKLPDRPQLAAMDQNRGLLDQLAGKAERQVRGWLRAVTGGPGGRGAVGICQGRAGMGAQHAAAPDQQQ